MARKTESAQTATPNIAATELPEPMPGLVVGRVVYFVLPQHSHENSHAGEIRPAIVVGVHDYSTVDLNVQMNMGRDGFGPAAFRSLVPYSDKHEFGSWHWMFAGQDKRYDPATRAVAAAIEAAPEAINTEIGPE